MQCIKLNQGYKDAYARVKNRKVGKEIREFSFSEKYIFGRFDSFCTRLRNLLSMFKKINLYTRLFNERMEALLPEEALEDDFKTFDSAVRVLTLRDYDYLDFRNEGFDKDYVEFLTRMDNLTEKLQSKIRVPRGNYVVLEGPQRVQTTPGPNLIFMDDLSNQERMIWTDLGPTP